MRARRSTGGSGVTGAPRQVVARSRASWRAAGRNRTAHPPRITRHRMSGILGHGPRPGRRRAGRSPPPVIILRERESEAHVSDVSSGQPDAPTTWPARLEPLDDVAELARVQAVIAAGPYDDDLGVAVGVHGARLVPRRQVRHLPALGRYAVPAFGNEWYARNMYVQGRPEFEHHRATYGDQTEFGYKDFLPELHGGALGPGRLGRAVPAGRRAVRRARGRAPRRVRDVRDRPLPLERRRPSARSATSSASSPRRSATAGSCWGCRRTGPSTGSS